MLLFYQMVSTNKMEHIVLLSGYFVYSKMSTWNWDKIVLVLLYDQKTLFDAFADWIIVGSSGNH